MRMDGYRRTMASACCSRILRRALESTATDHQSWDLQFGKTVWFVRLARMLLVYRKVPKSTFLIVDDSDSVHARRQRNAVDAQLCVLSVME
jgi:hypothetical protein